MLKINEAKGLINTSCCEAQGHFCSTQKQKQSQPISLIIFHHKFLGGSLFRFSFSLYLVIIIWKTQLYHHHYLTAR